MLNRSFQSLLALFANGAIIVDDYGFNRKLTGIGQVGNLILAHLLSANKFHFKGLQIIRLSTIGLASGQLRRWAFVTFINFLSHFNTRIIFIGLSNPSSFFPLARQSHQVIHDTIPFSLLNEKKILLLYFKYIPVIIIALYLSYLLSTLRFLMLARTRCSLYSVSYDACKKIDHLINPHSSVVCLDFILRDLVCLLAHQPLISGTSPQVRRILASLSLYHNSILIHTTGEPRKCFHELLPMLSTLKSFQILVYGQSWKGVGLKIVQDLFEENSIHESNKIHVLDSPNDVDVYALMRSVRAFIFPSRFEGYGLAPSIYYTLTHKKPFVAATSVNIEVLNGRAFFVSNWNDILPLLI